MRHCERSAAISIKTRHCEKFEKFRGNLKIYTHEITTLSPIARDDDSLQNGSP